MTIAVTAAFHAVVEASVVQLHLVYDEIVLANGCRLNCKSRLVTVYDGIPVPHGLLLAARDRLTVPPVNLFMGVIALREAV